MESNFMIHGHSDVTKLSRDTLSVSVTAESVLERNKKSGKKKQMAAIPRGPNQSLLQT